MSVDDVKFTILERKKTEIIAVYNIIMKTKEELVAMLDDNGMDSEYFTLEMRYNLMKKKLWLLIIKYDGLVIEYGIETSVDKWLNISSIFPSEDLSL